MNLEIFKLDSQEVAVLHALQKEFISKDIEETVDPTESKIKERWFKDWQKSFPNDVKNKGIFSDLFTSFKNDSVILKLGKLSSEKQKIILFELSIFLPYFKLKERQGNVAALKSIYSQKKKEEQILNPYIKEITDELKDVTFAKGFVGVRPQLIDKKSSQLMLGEAKINPGTGIVFNMTPSPGATSCLENAELDLRFVCGRLGAQIDETRLRADLHW